MVNNFTKLNWIGWNSTCNRIFSLRTRGFEFVNDCSFCLHDFFFCKQIRFAWLPTCFLLSYIDGHMIRIDTEKDSMSYDMT